MLTPEQRAQGWEGHDPLCSIHDAGACNCGVGEEPMTRSNTMVEITDADREAAHAIVPFLCAPTFELEMQRAFAAHRVQAERDMVERCAKVAEGTGSADDRLQKSAGCFTTGQRIAAAIRKLVE